MVTYSSFLGIEASMWSEPDKWGCNVVPKKIPFGLIWGWFWYQITRGPSLQRCPAFGQGMRRWCRWFLSFDYMVGRGWFHAGYPTPAAWIWRCSKPTSDAILNIASKVYYAACEGFNQCVEWNSKSSLLDRPLLKQVMGGTPKSSELWMIILRLKPIVKAPDTLW